MSRFDPADVAENWDITREKSGRKVATTVLAEGRRKRKVRVWVSDLPDENGICPVMGRYLLPYAVPVVEDGKYAGERVLWITRDQLKRLMKASGCKMRHGGIEDLLHIIAKGLDKLTEPFNGPGVKNVLIRSVINTARGKIEDHYLNEGFIEGLLEEVIH